MKKEMRCIGIILLMATMTIITGCGGGGGGESVPADDGTTTIADPSVTDPPATETLTNKLILYFVVNFNSDSYVPGYDITVESDTQYIFRYVQDSTSGATIIDQSYSPSYAKSKIQPYTVGDRFFIRQEWDPYDYTGYHYMYEYDPLTNRQQYNFRATEPYNYTQNCSAVVGADYYYTSNRTYDYFYGYKGGEFRHIDLTLSDSNLDGDVLIDFGDPDNCYGYLHSDNGALYDVKYDSDNSAITYYRRALDTGIPSFIGGLDLESNHTSLYYQSEYEMRVHNGVGYLARRRISDGGIELWKTDFVNTPRLIFDQIPDQSMNIHWMDVDDGYIALASDGKILVYDINMNTYSFYDVDTGGTMYGMQLLYINQ